MALRATHENPFRGASRVREIGILPGTVPVQVCVDLFAAGEMRSALFVFCHFRDPATRAFVSAATRLHPKGVNMKRTAGRPKADARRSLRGHNRRNATISEASQFWCVAPQAPRSLNTRRRCCATPGGGVGQHRVGVFGNTGWGVLGNTEGRCWATLGGGVAHDLAYARVRVRTRVLARG